MLHEDIYIMQSYLLLSRFAPTLARTAFAPKQAHSGYSHSEQLPAAFLDWGGGAPTLLFFKA